MLVTFSNSLSPVCSFCFVCQFLHHYGFYGHHGVFHQCVQSALSVSFFTTMVSMVTMEFSTSVFILLCLSVFSPLWFLWSPWSFPPVCSICFVCQFLHHYGFYGHHGVFQQCVHHWIILSPFFLLVFLSAFRIYFPSKLDPNIQKVFMNSV